jgi:RNA polymerase sigma-70 factor (ECF subfamily)
MQAVMTDQERIEDLLERARQGEPSALDALAREYRDELVAFADSRLGPSLRRELGPEDVAQETLLKALGALGRFEWRGESSFRRWLCGIAEHLIRNASRRRSASLKSLSIDLPGGVDSPSHAARKRERFERLERAIQELRPEHREVLRLARIEGLKVDEIARRMRRSPGAIHKLLARAMEQLKRRFGDTASLGLPDRALDFRSETDA